jgi:hypothetical protein
LHVGFDLCQFSQFLFWQYCVTAVTELPVEAFEFDVLDGFMSKTADAFTDGSCKFSQCSCCCYLKKKIIENSDLQNNKKERKKEKKKDANHGSFVEVGDVGFKLPNSFGMF